MQNSDFKGWPQFMGCNLNEIALSRQDVEFSLKGQEKDSMNSDTMQFK